MAKKDKDWRWKPDDPALAENLGMLYEPGNFGDLLKGVWLAEILRWRFKMGEKVHYADPFAGRPIYSLTDNARAHLSIGEGTAFCQAQAPFMEKGELASAAHIVRVIGENAGQSVSVAVYDKEEASRVQWATYEWAGLLDVADGWSALSDDPVKQADLVLVDPYDFLSDWKSRVPAIGALSETADVLLYVYNRSPQGRKRLDNYEAFRLGLREQIGTRRLIAGRFPSDARLPRAYHEVILIPAKSREEAPEESILLDHLISLLDVLTRALAAKIAASGAMDDLA